MNKKIIIKIIALVFAFVAGLLTTKNYILPKVSGENVTLVNVVVPKKEVIGFLPYWLISKADKDYSNYITNLTYFCLTPGEDGTIEKYTNPGESEPGYYSLISGKADSLLQKAKDDGLKLSLAIFTGDDEVISQMLKNPEESAANLLKDVTPIMQEYGFSELNLDIEQVSDASPEARLSYTAFVKFIKENLDTEIIKKLSIDVSASAFVKDTNLVDPASIVPYVDKVIIMAYDYHYASSYVTGPVAPGEGAGTVSEFDTVEAIKFALKVVPKNKIILGVPLYGYEWESLKDVPRSAVIPGSGMTISNSRAEEFLASCATCSATFDEVDKEKHIIYKDEGSDTYYQIFYPDKVAMDYKVRLAKNYSLGGMALWALGYEGETILEPLASYHN